MQDLSTRKPQASVRTMKEADTQMNSREDQIRGRAYELYEARGRTDGHDLEDWLEAEAETSGRIQTAAA